MGRPRENIIGQGERRKEWEQERQKKSQVERKEERERSMQKNLRKGFRTGKSYFITGRGKEIRGQHKIPFYSHFCELKRLKMPENLCNEKAQNTWIPVDWKGWKCLNTCVLKRLKIPGYLCTEKAENTWDLWTEKAEIPEYLWTGKKAENTWIPVNWKGWKYLNTCELKRLKIPEYPCTEKAENTWIPVNWEGWNTWIPVHWKGWKYLNTCELKRLKIPEYLWTEKAENTWIPVHWKGWKYLNTCALKGFIWGEGPGNNKGNLPVICSVCSNQTLPFSTSWRR